MWMYSIERIQLLNCGETYFRIVYYLDGMWDKLNIKMNVMSMNASMNWMGDYFQLTFSFLRQGEQFQFTEISNISDFVCRS